MNKFLSLLLILAVLVACEKHEPNEKKPKSQATELIVINNPPSQNVPTDNRTDSLDLNVDYPLKVNINGVEHLDFKGIFKGDLLTLYKGKSPLDYKLEITFWDMPRGLEKKVIAYPNPENSFDHATMSYDVKDPLVNSSMEWLKDFYYKVELGIEKDYKIPVKINAKIMTPYQISVKGEIEIATAGIRMTDGVIDKTFDDMDTIEWIVKDWIKKNTNAEKISNKTDACFMESFDGVKKKGVRQVAACSFLYTDDTSELNIAKLWLEKLDNKWQVIKRTPSKKLLLADSLKPPFKNSPPYIFDVIAATRFSETIYKKNDGYLNISESVVFPCGGGQAPDQPGWCELPYAFYEANRNLKDDVESECKFATYLFEKNKNGRWAISKELADDQKYDYRNMKIIPRDKDSNWGC